MTPPEYPPIQIIYFSDRSSVEVLDEWSGQGRYSDDPAEIKKMLTDASLFHDHITFQDNYGHLYFIDELIGHRVQVGDDIFIVPAF